MGSIFSDRISDVPRSFIREILKTAVDRDIISFAGGLPNRDLFPVEEIKDSAMKVLSEDGKDVLQYSTSEGYLPLREWISRRYREKKGLDVPPEQVLITSGSQQGLDLLGKTFLNEGDDVVIEEPGYLGAIQAFMIYRASFHPVPLNRDGIDTPALKRVLNASRAKLFYTVPNFQNPSGITYSDEVRKKTAELVESTDVILVEDDPYGELRFLGADERSLKAYAPHNTVLLGTFSKIVAPSFRIGWIAARPDIMEKLIVAKQATDLHTNYVGQRIIHRHLEDHDLEAHIAKIREAYGRQRGAMVEAIREHFPEGVSFTEPEGGMFLWITLPGGISSLKVFDRAIREKVAFVPGNPFYVSSGDVSTMRLNFSSVDEETIRTGIERLGRVIREFV